MGDTIDRGKLSEAFSYLASDAGAGALDALDGGLNNFRGHLGSIGLNDAEFNYLTTSLANQRSNSFSGSSGSSGRTANAAINLRHGFVIKAKI